jgi:hypothetical protein
MIRDLRSALASDVSWGASKVAASSHGGAGDLSCVEQIEAMIEEIEDVLASVRMEAFGD